MNAASPSTHNGNQLKLSALLKLEQARTLINSAREDMCNLEGEGYCDKYEETGKLSERLGSLTHEIRSLKPPTGVFTL